MDMKQVSFSILIRFTLSIGAIGSFIHGKTGIGVFTLFTYHQKPWKYPGLLVICPIIKKHTYIRK